MSRNFPRRIDIDLVEHTRSKLGVSTAEDLKHPNNHGLVVDCFQVRFIRHSWEAYRFAARLLVDHNGGLIARNDAESGRLDRDVPHRKNSGVVIPIGDVPHRLRAITMPEGAPVFLRREDLPVERVQVIERVTERRGGVCVDLTHRDFFERVYQAVIIDGTVSGVLESIPRP